MAEFLLKNGRVLAAGRIIENGYVLVNGDRIAEIGEGLPPPGFSGEFFDAEGRTISPGLIDMHTHGMLDVDFMSSGYDDIERSLYGYARFGVTRIVATLLSNPIPNIVEQGKLISEVMRESPIGAMIHGIHIEGPWLAQRCRGGHAAEYLKAPEKHDVLTILDALGNAIKSVTFAPELANTLWLTEELCRRGILPIIGHTEASFEEAERVIKAGVRHVTHFYDATLGYRENPDEALVMMPGMETAVLYYDDVSIELIGCPVHVPKPFFKFIAKVKPADKTIVVTDSLVGTGMPEGTVITYKDGRKVYVEEGVLRMIDDDPAVNGNLTGSAVTLNVALRRLAEFAELPMERAVEWGSRNPAVTLGIDDETGTLDAGKYADITVLDNGYNVHFTMMKGNVLYRKESAN